jgi:hypothetical protein
MKAGGQDGCWATVGLRMCDVQRRLFSLVKFNFKKSAFIVLYPVLCPCRAEKEEKK